MVTGHTDAKGAEAYNLKLSRQRAAAVVAALEAKGVSAGQLKSVGVGERDAKVSEKASDAERQADRRVVVEAVNGAAWEALQKSDLPVVEKKTVKKAPAKKRATKKK
ncbi:Photosystem I chlorophyll a apoprotein A2 [compost metagenome]